MELAVISHAGIIVLKLEQGHLSLTPQEALLLAERLVEAATVEINRDALSRLDPDGDL